MLPSAGVSSCYYFETSSDAQDGSWNLYHSCIFCRVISSSLLLLSGATESQQDCLSSFIQAFQLFSFSCDDANGDSCEDPFSSVFQTGSKVPVFSALRFQTFFSYPWENFNFLLDRQKLAQHCSIFFCLETGPQKGWEIGTILFAYHEVIFSLCVNEDLVFSSDA